MVKLNVVNVEWSKYFRDTFYSRIQTIRIRRPVACIYRDGTWHWIPKWSQVHRWFRRISSCLMPALRLTESCFWNVVLSSWTEALRCGVVSVHKGLGQRTTIYYKRRAGTALCFFVNECFLIIAVWLAGFFSDVCFFLVVVRLGK